MALFGLHVLYTHADIIPTQPTTILSDLLHCILRHRIYPPQWFLLPDQLYTITATSCRWRENHKFIVALSNTGDRWELLKQRLFPWSISPSSTSSWTSLLLSSADLDPALASFPVHLPLRPGTSLLDDEQNRTPFQAHLEDAHSDYQLVESPSHDNLLGLCAGPVDPGRLSSPPARGSRASSCLGARLLLV